MRAAGLERRLERKLDAIIAGLGLQESLWPPVSGSVRQLWSGGQRVEAIRAYRNEHPSLGLREAKEILEWTVGRS